MCIDLEAQVMSDQQQQSGAAGHLTSPEGGYSHPAPDGIASAAREHAGFARARGGAPSHETFGPTRVEEPRRMHGASRG
jgi:hypothetical protein